MAKDKTQEQLLKELTKEFSDDAIMQVKGGGGQFFDYIKGHHVIQRLNSVFGLSWSGTTIGTPVFHEDPISKLLWISVGVRLTVEIDGKIYQKDGWDSTLVKVYTDKFPNGSPNPKAGQIVDMGNSYKSTWTQALKKAASLMGVGLYLYFGGKLPDDDLLDIPDGDPFITTVNTKSSTPPVKEEKIIEKTMPVKTVTSNGQAEPLPKKPEWGGGVAESKTIKSGKDVFAEDAFFSDEVKIGEGKGLTKGPGTPVEASAKVEVKKEEKPFYTNPEIKEKPSIFSLNFIKMGITDLIKKGTIENKPIDKIIYEFIEVEGIEDPVNLNKEQARQLVSVIKTLKSDE